MIFTCPACSAGHSVPMSMIPTGGLEQVCRRCRATFLVDRPDDDAVGEAPGRAVAPVGAADEAGTLPALLDPQAGARSASFTDTSDEATLEQGAADALGEPSDDTLSAEPAAPPPEDRTPLVEVAPNVAPDAPAGEPSVYDRVAEGSYHPPEPRPLTAPRDSESRAWSEPSNPGLTAPAGPLGTAAARLNAAPLAAKVALLVFPLALGLTLVFTGGPGEDEVPIEIPVGPSEVVLAAAAPEPPPGAARPAPLEVVPEAPPEPEAPAAPEPVPPELEGPDRPAPAGYLYVQPKRLPLRAEADDEAAPVARLKGGRLVRVYETRGAWALVLREPDGPAGFVPRADLAALKPVSALAAEVAFPGCRAARRTERRACLDGAEASLEACQAGCPTPEVGEDDPGTRCLAACNLAFERCQRGCKRR
jgi:hypothetical protein